MYKYNSMESFMEKEIKKRKTIKIAGISIYRILAYFIIYCVVGFIIETLFGFFTKGTLESRKGFLYGPVCPIYGLGAVLMILTLQPLKKSIYKLFIGGFIVGSVIEYSISFFGELFLNVKWWDYSDRFLNLNGRICFTFSLFWGLLALYLLRIFNNYIDILIDKIKHKFSIKFLKTIVIILSIFLLADCIITGLALRLFFARTVYTYNLDVENKEKYISDYEKALKHNKLLNVTNKIFSDKKMIRTFPNLKLQGKNGEIIYFDAIYKDIQAYYYKFNF